MYQMNFSWRCKARHIAKVSAMLGALSHQPGAVFCAGYPGALPEMDQLRAADSGPSLQRL